MEGTVTASVFAQKSTGMFTIKKSVRLDRRGFEPGIETRDNPGRKQEY